jgi:hypothetical protein
VNPNAVELLPLLPIAMVATDAPPAPTTIEYVFARTEVIVLISPPAPPPPDVDPEPPPPPATIKHSQSLNKRFTVRVLVPVAVNV